MVLPWHNQVDIIAAFSLIGFFLISIPLYWHFQAWNVGCILYILWVGGQCLFHTVNLLIWKDNVINSAPVWCDIFIRFYIAASIGVCSASLVINRRLYLIATMSTVSVTHFGKWRRVIVDLLIGLGIPILAILVFWFYQGHRFNLVEGVGCVEAYPNTWLAIILYFIWPLIIGGISAVYCFFTLRAFLRRRKQFNELMASNEFLTFNRYFRLMGLAAVEAMFTIPLTIYNITINFKQGMYPWRGLSDLHLDFGRVDQYPAVIWRANPQAVSIINFRLWAPIACAIAFFLLFGFADEARKHYKIVLAVFGVKFGGSTADSRSTNSGSSASRTRGSGRATIPAFVNRPPRRRDSLESFYSDDVSTRNSAFSLDRKTRYAPSSRSVGSSTMLKHDATVPVPTTPPSSPDRLIDLSLPPAPVPILTAPPSSSVHFIDLPLPPAPVHHPDSPQRYSGELGAGNSSSSQVFINSSGMV